ncbi:MAG: recombinase family protein [Crocinitomicaceae bacterium]|nr:recombinase family protein [Crocinitomicaceae bacterium]
MSKLSKFEQFAPKSINFDNKKNAIIYTRVSTKDQADNNTSLGTQKKHCENYAQRNGYNVVQYFGGTHESAKSDDRKEFRRMLKYAKQSKTVGYIIVYSYDRFSRTGSSAAQITQELMDSGIQVKAVTQEVDTLSPAGKFQQNLFYMFSQFDNELRRDKTITAMAELLRKGYWLWTPPRGYVNKKKYHKAVEWEIVIDDEGKLLKKAFKWKLSGKYSNAEIVRKLNLLGMDINERRINEIFKNPFYCGILICKMLPGEVVEGKHKPIISQEDFLKINSVDSIHPEVKNLDNVNLPLKMYAHCDHCSEPLTGFLVKKKGLYYYKCRTKGCRSTKSAKKLHTEFASILSEYEIDPDLKGEIQEVMSYTFEHFIGEDVTNEKLYKKQKTEVGKKLESIEERFATGEINSEIFNKYSQKYNQELDEIDQKLENPEFVSSNLNSAIKKAVSIACNLSNYWLSGDLFEKKSIQRLVFPGGIGYNKQLDKVQTTRVNSLFSIIPDIKRVLGENKNGDSTNYSQISALVTTAGFKPATF